MRAIPAACGLALLSGALFASDLADVRVRLRHIAHSPGSLTLGEPLDLLVTTTNKGSRTLHGRFAAIPYDENAEFYWHRAGESATRLDEPYVSPRMRELMLVVKPPIRLGAGESVEAEGRILFDPHSGGLRVRASGEYRMFVVLRPLVDDPRQRVRSNTVAITVADPPQRDRAAFTAYLDARLEELVTSPFWRLNEQPESAVAAEAFLRQHAASLYGPHVQKALLKGLRHRVGSNRATSAEKEIYARLETDVSIRRYYGLGERP